MKILSILFRRSRRDVLVLSALGLGSGISSALLLAVIDRAVVEGPPTAILLATFGLIALIKVASGIGSNLLLVRFAQNTVLSLSRDLSVRILRTPFRHLEQIGAGRIIATLTDDVAVLSAAILAIPGIVVQSAVLVGCGVYLLWLSPLAFAVIFVIGAVGAAVHHRLMSRAHASIHSARHQRDRLFGHFRELVDGIKELKLNAARQRMFIDEQVTATSEKLARQNVVAMRHYAIADGWSQGLFLAVLFVLLCSLSLPEFLDRTAITGYLFAALYCMTPIWGLLAAIPTLTRGQIAWDRITEMGGALGESPGYSPQAYLARSVPPRIEFRAVSFSFEQKANGFHLGPLDLCLEPGELVYVIGGNGSGKSTLVKLLTGLYTPAEGEILVDGKKLEPSDIERYQSLFSTVFSDFHLFKRIQASEGTDVQDLGSRLLDSFELSGKTTIQDEHYSTISLSQGQKRRLALVSAYLEDRPVYILDEWAADQDPAFRQIFYTDVLQDLKSRGKTVVVITHDDRYFHLGDRLMKLDMGRFVELPAGASLGRAAQSRNAGVSAVVCSDLGE